MEKRIFTFVMQTNLLILFFHPKKNPLIVIFEVNAFIF